MEGCRRNYSSLSHQTPPTVISNKNNDPSSRVRNATHAKTLQLSERSGVFIAQQLDGENCLAAFERRILLAR